MANRVSTEAMEQIYTLFHTGAMGHWTDNQLVAQFSAGQEGSEAAFRVLIHRHGPMVLGVCRRILGDDHAAEDAFQATFLVLVKKAGTLRDCNLLTNWLYGVALKVASKDRAKGVRRKAIERRAAEAMTLPDADGDRAELRSVIDEEIRRLPERYRVPLVLCHVEGLRHHEVAHRLGCPVGTVESRLSRARDQLRTRLARRGLAPSAPALGIVLKPPGASAITPAIVESTLRAAAGLSRQRITLGAGIASLWSGAKQGFGLIPTFRPNFVASSLVVSASVAAMGLTVYRADGESPKPNSTLTPPPSTAPPQTGLAAAGSPSNDIERTRKPTKTLEPIAKNPPKQAGASATTRFPSAVARPLKDIVIDGRLEDWPRDTKTYPIANQLLDHTSYNQEPMTADQNPRAYFMAGYDPTAQQIYLAVVVHDDDVVVHPTDVLKTDSVEIYVDGTLSRKGDNSPSIGWEDTLDAATMPVIQYAGVPGRVAAYGDAWGANPSLVYARTREKTTKMKWRRERDVITYEWSFKAFDRFPDRATRLYPGKRLGLEVAVVDKDQATTTNKRPPTFLTWGAPPATFKGFDADSLGELILTDDKSP